jgi:hypothetical protein
MPKSRNRPVPKHRPSSKRRRWNWRRAAGGWAEFVRNLALLFFGAPFVEPLLAGAAVDLGLAIRGLVAGIVLLALSTILDVERRD